MKVVVERVLLQMEEDVRAGCVVRISPSIGSPFFGWGGVPLSSFGTVTDILYEFSVRIVEVFFPEHQRWLAFPHELVAVTADETARVGDHVRIRENVTRPRFSWGKVTPASVGIVRKIEANGAVFVEFPEQRRWKALNCELETVSEVCRTARTPEEVSVTITSSDEAQPFSPMTSSGYGRVVSFLLALFRRDIGGRKVAQKTIKSHSDEEEADFGDNQGELQPLVDLRS